MRRAVHRAPRMCVCALVCVWLGDLRWTLTRRLLVVVYCLAVYSLGSFFLFDFLFFFFNLTFRVPFNWFLPSRSLPPSLSLSPFSFPAFASLPFSLSIYCFFSHLSLYGSVLFGSHTSVSVFSHLSFASLTSEQSFFFFLTSSLSFFSLSTPHTCSHTPPPAPRHRWQAYSLL